MITKPYFLFCVAFLLISQFGNTITVEDCSSVGLENDLIFDICSFDKNSPHSISYEEDVVYDFELNISLSSPLVPSCDENSSTKVFATFRDRYFANQCFDIAIDNPNATLIDPENENKGISLIYPHNKESVEDYKLVITLLCDRDVDDGYNANFTVDSVVDKTINVIASSPAACPVHGLFKFTHFLQTNRYKLFAIFLVVGFLLCFFGLKLFSIAVFIVGTILGTFVSAVFFFERVGLDTPTWGLWLLFIVSFIPGGLVGFIAVKLEALGFICLGVALGLVGGLAFYGGILAPFFDGSINTLYFTLVIFAVMGGIVAYKTWKDIIIIATASVGSYMMVRSVAVVTTGFPSEQMIAQGLSNWTTLTYVYMGFIVVLAISGGCFQWKRHHKSKMHSDSHYSYSNIEKKV